MRIALNLLYMLPGVVGGTQSYAMHLIRTLSELDKDNEYFLYLNRESADLDIVDAPNFKKVVCPVRATSRSARYFWEQTILPLQLAKNKIDLVHSLGYVGPLRTPCPHVVTIHDLIYAGYQDSMDRKKMRVLEYFVRRTAETCTHIITVSEASRKHIASDIGISADKITSIHHGARPIETQISEKEAAEALAVYGIKQPYIVAFSSLNPSKNMPRLLEAYARVQSEFPHGMVLIGHIPPQIELRDKIKSLGIEERVTVTGYVPDDHIYPLIMSADLFAFPSLYEGFGMPVLDAQFAGVPLVCSNAASLPEVAGGAAVFFNPRSVDEIEAALRRTLADPELRKCLVAKGHQNTKRFSWEEAGRKTLAVYKQACPARS